MTVHSILQSLPRYYLKGLRGSVYFCTMDGFFRNLKKTVFELICTRLYVYLFLCRSRNRRSMGPSLQDVTIFQGRKSKKLRKKNDDAKKIIDRGKVFKKSGKTDVILDSFKNFKLKVSKHRKQNTKFYHSLKNQRNFAHFFALATLKVVETKNKNT